jgi:sarcosine oxidase subunit alpha
LSSKERERAPIPFSLEGERLQGRVGDTLAAALLRNGITTFTRSIKYHRPRGPFCFTGNCGQCLVRVDGVPSLPACQVELQPGMACDRQNAPLGLIEQDLFRAVDFIYPEGLDHHHLMIQSRLLGRVALEVARRLAGLGTLPDKDEPAQAGSAREVPLVIIGAGRSGLAAARAAIQTGIKDLKPLILEREDEVGGANRLWVNNHRYTNDLPAGAELLLSSEVIGLYADESPSGPALLAVRQGSKLLAIRARRVLLATGGSSQPLPFPGNDRPGVYAARGLLELHRRSGVRVGEEKAIVVAGSGAELSRCASALLASGYAIAALIAIDDAPVPDSPEGIERLQGELIRARGRPVAEVQVRLKNGDLKKLRCGAVAIALPPAPLYDLAGCVGARAEQSADLSGFPLVIDDSGRTTVPWIFACGTVTGMVEMTTKAGAQVAREASALEGAQHAT